MDELHAFLRLTRVPGLHSGILRPLLQKFASAAGILRAGKPALTAAGTTAAVARHLLAANDPAQLPPLQAALRWLEQPRNTFIAWGSADYPPLLATLRDAPVGLFVRGDPQCLYLPQIAMVGSRNPTSAGRETASAFAAHLARSGLTITSGLALGIDAAAHRGALGVDGRTIAVCGTGLDSVYPREHTALAREIEERGALVSEFPPGTPAVKSNFPRRNRLISGLCLGTLVVEAATRSGSLITASLAADQGREVFAIPGSIHNPLARGCHQLIRQGAKLVETSADIVSELAQLTALLDADSAAGGGVKTQLFDSDGFSSSMLDKDHEILLDALGFDPAGVDVLVGRTGFKADAVASMLLILELEGCIESRPGGLYARKGARDRHGVRF